MSDTYNYSAGAVHHDHHRSITINGASGRDLQALLKAFMADEADDAEVASFATATRYDSVACDERNFSSSEERASAPLDLSSQRSTTVHDMPEALLTDAARALHARLREAGMVDERWQPVGLSNAERGTLAEYLTERLNIGSKWKLWGELWGMNPETLRTAKARGLEQERTWAFRSRLDAL